MSEPTKPTTGRTVGRRADQHALYWRSRNKSLDRLITDTGKRLRELRLSQGYSQADVRRIMGLQNVASHSRGDAIGDVELGKSAGITLFRIWRVADALGYDVEINFVRKKVKKSAVRPTDGPGQVPSGDQGGDGGQQGPEQSGPGPAPGQGGQHR